MRFPWIGVFLLSCVNGPGTEPFGSTGSPERFAAEIQPVLASRCANPACHGSADRPLEVFAVHLHRMDPEDTYIDDPLTKAELWQNQWQFATFLIDLDVADNAQVLSKPLAPEAGGLPHQGGVQFQTVENGDYGVLRAWILDELGASER